MSARLLALLAFIPAFVLAWLTYVSSDDHFGRISPGRQIAVYGELPFRDYFDPGYFLTELASAAVQRVFGDNLLGELLLNTAFIAGGAVAVLFLARRVSGSWLVGAAAAFIAAGSLPRAYDYDKCLFYPLGVLFCWRYIDRPNRRSLIALALVIVAAGLFRYDNGLFILFAALVGMAVLHLRSPRILARHAAGLTLAMAIASAPAILFLQATSGVFDAATQMLAYGTRERNRTRLERLPSFELAPAPTGEAAAPDRVFVHWSAETETGTRTALESRFGLREATVAGDPENRTWSYRATDASADNLRALVTSPEVEDTHLIDRARFAIVADGPPPPGPLARLTTRVLHVQNGASLLYYTFAAAIAIALLAGLRRATQTDAAMRQASARLLALAALSAVVMALIVRDPVSARIGGAIGPLLIVAAWLPTAAPRRVRFAASVAVWVLLFAGTAALAEWRVTLPRALENLPRMPDSAARLAKSPPSLDALPSGRLGGLILYVRECTTPQDRVYASWFAPELYFFSQRAFAGGMVVTFGRHWTAPEYQQRIVDKLRSESVPVVFHEAARREFFSMTYPIVDEYLQQRYELAGTNDFGRPGGEVYAVLVERRRQPVRTHGPTGLPCFAAEPRS